LSSSRAAPTLKQRTQFRTSGFFLSDFTPGGDPWVQAGLVAITSPCATVTPGSSVIIGVQVLGIVAAFVRTFGTATIVFTLIHKIIGLRVSREEEMTGLDFGEHAGNAYLDFEVSSYIQD